MQPSLSSSVRWEKLWWLSKRRHAKVTVRSSAQWCINVSTEMIMTILVDYFGAPPRFPWTPLHIFLCFSSEAFNQWLFGVEIWKPQGSLGPQGYSGTKETKSSQTWRQVILLAVTEWLWHSFMLILLGFVVICSVIAHINVSTSAHASLTWWRKP